MPRTAGSKNSLRKIDGYYIPTEFVNDLQQKQVSAGLLPGLVRAFAKAAQSRGFSQQHIYDNAADMAATVGIQEAYAEALQFVRIPSTGYVNTPKAVITENSYEEVEDPAPAVATTTATVASAPAPTDMVQAARNVVFDARNHAGPGNFTTNGDMFHGAQRIKDNVDAFKMPFTYIQPQGKQTDRILDIIARGKRPVALIGPTGSGKSTLPMFYAAEMGLDIILIGCTGQTDVTDLLGSTMIVADPNTGQPVTKFINGPLTEAIIKGKVVVIDEFTALKPQIQMVFQQLNNGDPFVVTTRGDGYVAPRHPNFRIIFTANPASYAGCNELGSQIVNRPFVFEVGYVDAKTETHILTANHPSMTKTDASMLVKFANQTRKKLESDPTTKYVVATRDLVKIAELMTEYNCTMIEAVEIGVLNAVQHIDTDEYDAMKTLVRDFFPVTA